MTTAKEIRRQIKAEQKVRVDEANKWHRERLKTGHDCPRCGVAVMRKPGRGRPPVWCSPACRRAASSERLRASVSGEPVAVVEIPTATTGNPGYGGTARFGQP